MKVDHVMLHTPPTLTISAPFASNSDFNRVFLANGISPVERVGT
jgi:hypothetical protein